MTIELKQLVLGVGLPAAVALAVAAPLSWAARTPSADGAWSTTARILAVTMGVLAAHLALLGIQVWPPGAPGRLPAAIAAIAAVEVAVAWVARRWAVVALRALLTAFLLYALVWPLARTWPGARAAGVMAGFGAALVAGPAILNWVARRRTGAAAPLVLWCSASLAAVGLVLSYTARFGQLSGALAASVAPLVLLGWWRPAITWTGAAAASAWVLASLLLAGNLYAGLLPARGILLATAPFASALAMAPLAGRNREWVGTLVAVAVAAAIAGTAVALAARTYEPAG